jgi:hypothetical protein
VRHERPERRELVPRATGRLAEQVAQGQQQTAQHQPEPDQGQRAGRGVPGDHRHPQQPVERARATTGQPARPQTGPADLAVGHLRVRGGDHPVAVEVGPPAELDAVAEHRHRRVEPVQVAPDGGPHQHPAGGHTQAFGGLVALALVDLAPVEQQVASTGARDRDADLAQLVVALPAPREQQLGAGHVDVLLDGDVGQQPVEGVGGRDRVVVQQPQPAAVAGPPRVVGQGPGVEQAGRAGLGGPGPDRPVLPQRGGDRLAEAVRLLADVHRVEQTLGPSPFEQRVRAVGAAVVDGDDPGGPDVERGQAGEGGGEPAGGVEADEDGGDVEAADVDAFTGDRLVRGPGPRVVVDLFSVGRRQVLPGDVRRPGPAP